MRWSSVAAALAAFALAGGVVRAAGEPPPTSDLRAYVVAQLDAQAEVLTRTRDTVDQKLAAAGADRAHRVRAAYRLLRAGSAPAWVEADERMATARRRAAARWVLTRDRREEALLADESASLAAADARLSADRVAAVSVALPPTGLPAPVTGTVIRGFGPFAHDRSKATLSRRGLDYEVLDHADVHAIADGVVLYAGAIRGLDDGVVIDHGGWLSVTGKLATPTVARGDHVTAGQSLAEAKKHRVYLEIRVAVSPGGVPVDPERLMQ